jgi:hypothetical protein
MKIDFNANYRDVAAITDASARPTQKLDSSNGFGKLLRSISPEKPQLAETKTFIEPKLDPGKPPDQDSNGPMASYKFPPPQLYPPMPAAAGGGPLDIKSVKEEPGGVKTPAFLELRRIPARNAVQAADPPPEQRPGELAAVGKMMTEIGRSHGIDPSLGMSVVAAESGFNPTAVSRDGHESKGLFQLLDSTGKDMKEKLGVSGRYTPFDPHQNINLGLGYLRRLHDIFSQETELPNQTKTVAAANSSSLEKLAVAAFNAGEGRVAAAQQRAARAGLNPAHFDLIKAYLPESTKEYVERVMALKSQYHGLFVG